MMDHLIQELALIGPMDIIGPMIGACVFIALMSLLPEPTRQQFNAILVAGAGAAYFNAGLDGWEYVYTVIATVVAFFGLRSYRFIALAWIMHTSWDMVHHLYGTPIWPWLPMSSVGCAVFDAVIALWFFFGAGSMLTVLQRRRANGVA